MRYLRGTISSFSCLIYSSELVAFESYDAYVSGGRSMKQNGQELTEIGFVLRRVMPRVSVFNPNESKGSSSHPIWVFLVSEESRSKSEQHEIGTKPIDPIFTKLFMISHSFPGSCSNSCSC